MRLMVALEDRFLKTGNGNIYSMTVYDYGFWQRYLHIFDEVVVLARVSEIEQQDLSSVPANGYRVRFQCLPTYIGPWKYMLLRRQLKTVACAATEQADAFILRVPGAVSSLLWRCLREQKIPYAVEVVGDPWDSLAPGSVRSILRPLLRRKMARDMALQCRSAMAASYVTEYTLQKRYSSGCWSTHYSSIELSGDVIVDDCVIEGKIAKAKAKFDSDIPFRICQVGMMEHLYKAPDVLIDAVGICIKKGFNVELVLVGDGRFRPQLEEQAKKSGIADKVKFLGKLAPGQAIYDELDKSDLYVLPSRQEGLPRTVIEAMARGVPCIGSNVGGFPELLDPGDVVPSGNAKLLAEKIGSVISDIERLKRMAKRNLQTVDNYRSDVLNKRRIEFYSMVRQMTVRK